MISIFISTAAAQTIEEEKKNATDVSNMGFLPQISENLAHYSIESQCFFFFKQFVQMKDQIEPF